MNAPAGPGGGLEPAWGSPSGAFAASPKPLKTESRRIRSWLRAARWLAWACFVLGATVLLGWTAQIGLLINLIPGQVPTSPATALGLVLSAIAILSLIRRDAIQPISKGPRLARGIALVLIAAGVARIFGWAFHYDLGIDALGLHDELAQRLGWPSTQMAINTAFAFILCGVAIGGLAINSKHAALVAQSLALGLALLSFLVVVGHAFDAPAFYHWNTSYPMAVPSALGFSMLGLAILLSRPDHGLMAVVSGDGPGSTLARRLIPPCILLPILLGGGLFLASHYGSIKPTLASGLTILSTIIVLLALIWGNATVIEAAEQRRHRADEELRRSEIFYHTLVETLPQNILRKDAEGRFTFANRLCAKTFGREQNDLNGKTDLDLFPHALAEKYRADDQRVMASGTRFETVEDHITPDGQTHYVHVIKTPLFDDSGRPIGIQGIFWDVTASLLAEKRLLEQNVQLQELAASEHRAHEELKQAQARMVETAKLAGLGQMVAGVAHEINNPLAFVLNNIVVLERDLAGACDVLTCVRRLETQMAPLAPEACCKIRELWDQADVDYTISNLPGLLARTREGLARIQGIVKDLRAFARVDEDAFVDADINQGIESTVHILLGNAKSRGIALELNLSPLPPGYCQPAKLNQVIMNLVSNAIEASSAGSRVVVASRQEPGKIVIEVIDNGSGIAPEVRDRIFDPFFTTKPIGEGTGLGLSISYGIVKEHDGAIEVDSIPGVETRFRVGLPIRDRQPGRQPQGVADPATERRTMEHAR